MVAVRLFARGVGALRGTLTGEGDFERRRTGLGFGDLVERAGIAGSLAGRARRHTVGRGVHKTGRVRNSADLLSLPPPTHATH